MADKIDQLTYQNSQGTNVSYDIDLPPDATPSITSLTASGNIEGGAIKKTGGTSSQFLKADGSTDSTSYLPLSAGSSNSLTGNLYTGGNGIIFGTNYQIIWDGEDTIAVESNNDIVLSAINDITLANQAYINMYAVDDITLESSSGYVSIKTDTYKAMLDTSDMTANHYFSFPNDDGTLALTKNLPQIKRYI